jgi:hypothetical protein
MARVSPMLALPSTSPTREQPHDMPSRRTSMAGSIATSTGIPSPSRFSPALTASRAHLTSSNGQPASVQSPMRYSVNGDPVRHSGFGGQPRQSMSGAPRQSMSGSAIQYGLGGVPTSGLARKSYEIGSVNEGFRHSSHRQEGYINHHTLTIDTSYESDGKFSLPAFQGVYEVLFIAFLN